MAFPSSGSLKPVSCFHYLEGYAAFLSYAIHNFWLYLSRRPAPLEDDQPSPELGGKGDLCFKVKPRDVGAPLHQLLATLLTREQEEPPCRLQPVGHRLKGAALGGRRHDS